MKGTQQQKPATDAGLDHGTLRALVDALHVVADLLDPAGARRRQEQAEQPPQRRRQRRTR